MQLPLVREAMTGAIVTCSESSSIEQAAKLMVDNHIRSIVVENRIGKPVGIITGGDIVTSLAKKISPDTSVSEIIGKSLITVDADENIVGASNKMNSKNIKRLLVTDGGKVVGILSVNDVLRYYPKYLQEFSNTLSKLDTIMSKL